MAVNMSGMLVPITQVVIQQNKNNLFPNRNLTLYWNFVISYECNSDWKEPNKLKVVLPKKITITDSNGNQNPIYDTSQYTGFNGYDNTQETNGSPLIMRGDSISVRSGYGGVDPLNQKKYYVPKELYQNSNSLEATIVKGYQFEGYVTDVHSNLQIEILALDNTWLLQQCQMANRHWVFGNDPTDTSLFGNKYTKGQNMYLEDILYSSLYKNCLTQDPYNLEIFINAPSAGQTNLYTNLKTNDLGFFVGDVITNDVTIATFIQDVKRKLDFEIYFRKNQLHLGTPIYNPNTKLYHFLTFQVDPVFNNKLTYNNEVDIKLSAVVNILNQQNTQMKTTIDGRQKAELAYIKLLVINKNPNILIPCPNVANPSFNTNGSGPFTFDDDKYKNFVWFVYPTNVEQGQDQTIKQLNDILTAYGGETNYNFSYYYNPQVPAIQSIPKSSFKPYAQKAVDQLSKYYYTGFAGSIETFGMPFYKSGDAIVINDTYLPERNGSYIVRSVTYRGGNEGLKQEIMLDYKESGVYYTPDDVPSKNFNK